MVDTIVTKNPAQDQLFTREEVLGGLQGRRARHLLYEIERRTALLTEQWRTVIAFSASPDGMPGPGLLVADLLSEEVDDDPFDPARWRHQLPLKPTIRDIERHTKDWIGLVPANARGRAALAHALKGKYRFDRESVPGIRAALGLDEEATQTAYQQVYGEALETIYTPAATARERLTSILAMPLALLERLPPFWAAFALLFLLPMPQAFLATPIAVADVGVLGGIAILLVVGAIGVLTVGYTAEATARSRTMRFGTAFVGRLGADFLGRTGSLALTGSVALLFFLALVSSDLGLAQTMDDLTGLPMAVWSVALAAIVLAAVFRGRKGVSLGLMLLLAALNLALVAAIVVLALTHFSGSNLDGDVFDASGLERILGVAIMCWFGHGLVPPAARVVLRRDPEGGAFIRGALAGTAGLVVLVAVWTLAVAGALPRAMLAGDPGTVIAPLGDEVGLGINVLGAILIITTLGMTALRCAVILSNLTLERLPLGKPREIDLPRSAGRLTLCSPEGTGPVIGVRYLGLTAGTPRLRVDVQLAEGLQSTDVALTGRWRLDSLAGTAPGTGGYLPQLWIEGAGVAEGAIRLRLGTRLSVSYRPDGGLRTADLLGGDADTDALVRDLQRRGAATIAEIAARTGWDEAAVRTGLTALVEQGAVVQDETDHERYQIHYARRRGRALPGDVWSALEEPPADSEAPAQPTARERFADSALGGNGRVWLSLAPVVAGFLVAAWLEFGADVSYASILAFTGVVSVSVFGGLMPPLLLIAARRKGEVVLPAHFGRLGHPAVAGAVYLVFFANLVLHGLVIWNDPYARAGALLLAIAMAAGTLALLRGDLLKPRLAVEMRLAADGPDRASFAIAGGGEPLVGAVTIVTGATEQTVEAASGDIAAQASLRAATFRLPATEASSLRIWGHQVSQAESEPLPALVTVRDGGRARRFDLQLAGGQTVVPIQEGELTVEMTLAQPDAGKLS